MNSSQALSFLPLRRVLFAALLAASAVTAAAPAPSEATIDATARSRVLDHLIEGLQRQYVFPEKAEAMGAHLRAQRQQGAYDAFADPTAFAERLTQDLQTVSHDVHLMVEYSEEVLPEFNQQQPSAKLQAQELAIMRQLNFGLERIERLPFNIGYLKLDGFAPADAVKSRLAAAMTLLADTRALIFDLRENHGGEPETVQLLASYLFDRRTHITDFYWRAGDRTEQVWTIQTVDGPRYGAARPVYVLLSRDSFSAAEGFSYALQNLARAVIVGEPSGGGAHPGDPVRLDDHFSVFIPNGRSISPVTGTNWEGVGVKPDLAIAPEQALAAAQQHLLKQWLESEADGAVRERMQQRVYALQHTPSDQAP